MAKHHEEENEVLNFIESPKDFIDLIVKNEEDKDWVLNEVLYGGPKHKQAYSTLLLQRMHELIHAIEKETGKTFSVQKGINLISHKEEWEIPVPLVLSSVKKQNQKEVEDVLSHAPAH